MPRRSRGSRSDWGCTLIGAVQAEGESAWRRQSSKRWGRQKMQGEMEAEGKAMIFLRTQSWSVAGHYISQTTFHGNQDFYRSPRSQDNLNIIYCRRKPQLSRLCYWWAGKLAKLILNPLFFPKQKRMWANNSHIYFLPEDWGFILKVHAKLCSVRWQVKKTIVNCDSAGESCAWAWGKQAQNSQTCHEVLWGLKRDLLKINPWIDISWSPIFHCRIYENERNALKKSGWSSKTHHDNSTPIKEC